MAYYFADSAVQRFHVFLAFFEIDEKNSKKIHVFRKLWILFGVVKQENNRSLHL